MHVAGTSPISSQTLNSVINAKNDNEVNAILAQFKGNKSSSYLNNYFSLRF